MPEKIYKNICLSQLSQYVLKHGNVVIYGFGVLGQLCYRIVVDSGLQKNIKIIVDRIGPTTISEVPVYPPEELLDFKNVKVIIASFEYAQQIADFLINELKFSHEQLVLLHKDSLSDQHKNSSDKWLEGAQDELFFWESKIAIADSEEMKNRAASNKPFDKKVLEAYGEIKNNRLNVIDVGSGPYSVLGYRAKNVQIDLVLVDPLAKEYSTLYKRYNKHPPVLPIACRGEDILDHFPLESFDIAFSRNALDHAEDPLAIMLSMCRLLKIGGLFYVTVCENEGEKANYQGLHSWNFTYRAGSLVLWNKTQEINVSEQLKIFGDLQLNYNKAERMIIFYLNKTIA